MAIDMAKKHKADYEWIKRAYVRYNVSLRKDTDTDIIAFVEANKADASITEIFRQGVRLLMEKEK